MAPNPYDTCPCGSGKKFKFCCEKYFDKIEQALTQHQNGQHEMALRTMEGVVKDHPDYAPAWGYYAHLLYLEGQIEKAEEVVQKAFALNPNFAMGHLLRGIFRQAEGEVIGALLLFRKAAEAYDPGAHDQLAQVYELIARNELMLNRPVACRAALERAVHSAPGDADLREQFEAMFGDGSRMPDCARNKYAFRATAKPVRVDAATGRFSDARKAFEELCAQVPDDPAGWFNLGLVRAWQGDQPAAVEALQKSLEKEWDDAKAEETAALVEVLRCGHGMENESDYTEHRAAMPVRDPEALFGLLQQWDRERKMIGAQADPNSGFFSCVVVEPLPTLLETGTTMARVAANLAFDRGVLQVRHPDPESVRKVVREIRDRVNLAVGEPTEGTGPGQFGDIAVEALAYPVRATDVGQAEAKLRDHARHYFEDVWPTRPLRSLGGATPVDAAGSTLLRKRLLGVVRFLQDCVTGAAPRKQAGEKVEAIAVYDFDRLRHKLGVELRPPGDAPAIAVPADPTSSAATPTVPTAPAKRDWGAMSAADLAAVSPDGLTCGELEDAMRAALKLDARELAVRFAAAGAGKPFDAAKPDRYPFYAVLIQGAQSDGDTAKAIEHAAAGATYDAEHNGGKRANEFGTRKAQLHAKRGETDAAAAAFDDLIARNPDDGKFVIAAAEAMLSARQGEKALRFAEQGLAKARSSGNRDLEGACLELSDAARRQMK